MLLRTFEEQGRMFLRYFAFASFLMLFAGAGCERQTAGSQAAGGGGAPPAPPVVSVAKPVEREVVDWDEYVGRLDAVDAVDVRARVSGYVQSVHFKDGDVVKEG